MTYLFISPLLVLLPGSALAAAVGRSFRSGLWACTWAVVLGAAAGSWRARRRRARQHADLAPTA
jgi:threonine/homoserine/homoserine lactone efflux protein